MLWRRVEEAKRWLIYDLLRLELPFATRDGTPLLFDILSEHGGAPVMTGHLNGIVTLNLAEADDVEREMRRIHFCEPYRTLLGHFRHEVGHFYWQVLVGDTDLKGPFKLIFGDEAEDYAAALASYYDKVSGTRDFGGFITEYASAHPWEDWAETFAHFLHIVSTLDSLAGLPLAVESRSRQTFENPYLEADFDELLASWKAVARSINKLNRSLGLRDAYPFDLSQAAIGKLHFIHLAVQGLRRIRSRAGLSDAAEV